MMSTAVYREWPDRMTVEEYLAFEERGEERHEYFAGEFTLESIGLTLSVESLYS